MTDHAINAQLDLAIMAGIGAAWLLILGGLAWVETRKRRTENE